MILPVYLYGHPVLRQETEAVDSNNCPDLKTLVADMWETMYHSEGVGLAAPQVGKSLRLLVIDGSPLADRFEECRDSKMVVVNPEIEIIEDSEPVTREEGCLSLPGLSEPVKRFEHLRMRWQDEDLQQHEAEFHGFLARIIQHEFDHLEGKVYIDRVTPIRKQLIRNKLNNIVKGKVNCDYKVCKSPK